MVFLQEVKSNGFKLGDKMNYCWNGPFGTSKHCQGRGSVVISLSSYLYSFAFSSSSYLNDKCVWDTLFYSSSSSLFPCNLFS